MCVFCTCGGQELKEYFPQLLCAFFFLSNFHSKAYCMYIFRTDHLVLDNQLVCVPGEVCFPTQNPSWPAVPCIGLRPQGLSPSTLAFLLVCPCSTPVGSHGVILYVCSFYITRTHTFTARSPICGFL